MYGILLRKRIRASFCHYFIQINNKLVQKLEQITGAACQCTVYNASASPGEKRRTSCNGDSGITCW